MNKKLDYDFLGNNPNNLVKETHIVTSNKSDDRIKVFEHGPMFGVSVTVRVAGSESSLRQGFDYEFIHELTALEEILAAPCYCGIELANPAISGEIEISGQTIGGDFAIDAVGILDYLVKYLNNPRETDYLKLANVPTLFPRQQTYRDWSDFLNKQYLANGLDDLAQSSDSGVDEVNTVLNAIRTNIANLNLAVTELGYDTHSQAINPHNTTIEQLNAHDKMLAVSDTLLAYGKDFLELCEYVRERGLTEEDISKYVDEYTTGVVTGKFDFINGSGVIRSEDGLSKIEMDNGRMLVTSNGTVVLDADYDCDNNGTLQSIKSGSNVLTIISKGDSLEHATIKLNGVDLITNKNIVEYQAGSGDDEELTVSATSSTLRIEGRGTTKSPLKAHVILVNASDSVPGIAKTKHTSGTETGNVVAHPSTLEEIVLRFSEYVSKSIRLNDKPLVGDGIEFTRYDANVDQTDNTRDLDKPLSDKLKEEIEKLADASHTHTWASLNVPHATESLIGIAEFEADSANIEDDQAATPKILKEAKTELEKLYPKYQNTISASDIEFSAVAANGFNVSRFVMSAKKPIEWFISKDGVMTKGEFTGSVNLAETTSVDWVREEDSCETFWSDSVRTDHPTDWFALYNCPMYAHVYNTVPTPANAKLYMKRRIYLGSRKARITAYTDDGAKLYLDGVVIGESSSSGEVSALVNIVPGTHVVAVVATNATADGRIGISAVVEEIAKTRNGRTERVVVDGTFNGWKCKYQYGDVAEVRNNKFYIYGDTETGEMFSRTAPLKHRDVSGRYVFITSVKTDENGVAGGSFDFSTNTDYGMFNELRDHEVIRGAHGRAGEGIVGLENLVPMANAGGSAFEDFNGIVIGKAAGSYASSSRFVGNVTVAKGLHPDRAGECTVFQNIPKHTPAKWFTSKNPLANGADTYEGTLHACHYDMNLATKGLNVHTPAKFVFGTVQRGDYRDLLAVTFNTSLEPTVTLGKVVISPAEFGRHTIKSAESNGISWQSTEPFYKIKSLIPSIVDGAFSTTSKDFYKLFSFVKYRYDVDNNTLNLLVGHGTRVMVWELRFDVNIRPYFEGDLIGAIGQKTMAFGGVVDALNISKNLIEMVNNYRSLFECYITNMDVKTHQQTGFNWTGFSMRELLDKRDITATDYLFTNFVLDFMYTTANEELPPAITGGAMLMKGSGKLNLPLTTYSENPGHGTISHTGAKSVTVARHNYTRLPCSYQIQFGVDLPAGTYELRGFVDDTAILYVDGEQKLTWTLSQGNYTGTFTVSGGNTNRHIIINTYNGGGPSCLSFAILEAASKRRIIDSNRVFEYFAHSTAHSEVLLSKNPWMTSQSAWEKVLTLI